MNSYYLLSLYYFCFVKQGWRRIPVIGGAHMEILHGDDPRFGVALRDDSGAHPVIRLPRNESLRILPKSGCSKIYETLVACELLSGKSLDRGECRRVYCDGDDGGAPMYSCLGVLASRTGGVDDMKKCYSSLSRQHWRVLMKMTTRAEAAFESFADTCVIHQLMKAKEHVPFKTMTSPHSITSAKYFGAMAFGRNVFARCHTDEDFTISVTQIYLEGVDECGIHDRVVAFFCFPTLGVAIPMRPGDYVLFDATIPHCVSSRCHSGENIMGVSFYLKSLVVGMNNNTIPLTRKQIYLASLHTCMHSS